MPILVTISLILVIDIVYVVIKSKSDFKIVKFILMADNHALICKVDMLNVQKHRQFFKISESL